jgi:hypothetical protein
MFEIVEAAAARAPNKCSNCHAVGHTMTSKTCPLRHSDSRSQSGFALKLPLQSTSVLDSIPGPIADLDSCSMEVLPTSVDLMASAVSEPNLSPLPTSLLLSHQSPRCDSPQAIYQRYVAARNTWYMALPRGSIKTNQQYRKAMGLPLRFSKKSYEWCLDYKQMTKRCITSTGSREWTKEEMMAYLDWDKAEDERIEALVQAEIGDNPFGGKRRGVGDIWERVGRDIREQEALYSAQWNEEQCIIVEV